MYSAEYLSLIAINATPIVYDFYFMYYRLGRTPEFLIYGHGQQRRAVIEALRLVENGKNNGRESAGHKLDELASGNTVQSFKEVSKKWQKFVTQVHLSYLQNTN